MSVIQGENPPKTVASSYHYGHRLQGKIVILYYLGLAAVQKSGEGNPFQAYLGEDVSDKVNQDCQQCLEMAITQVTRLWQGVGLGVPTTEQGALNSGWNDSHYSNKSLLLYSWSLLLLS